MIDLKCMSPPCAARSLLQCLGRGWERLERDVATPAKCRQWQELQKVLMARLYILVGHACMGMGVNAWDIKQIGSLWNPVPLYGIIQISLICMPTVNPCMHGCEMRNQNYQLSEPEWNPWQKWNMEKTFTSQFRFWLPAALLPFSASDFNVISMNGSMQLWGSFTCIWTIYCGTPWK